MYFVACPASVENAEVDLRDSGIPTVTDIAASSSTPNKHEVAARAVVSVILSQSTAHPFSL